MQNTINHKIFYSQSPEEVWQYLTRPELIELWLMKNDFHPTVGHQFQFKTGPLPNFDFDGNIYCTVMEVTPFTKLSYSWKGGPGDGRITFDSVVEWTLHPKDNGTELEIVHSGFKVLENLLIFNAMNDGWLKNMKKIVELLNNARNATTNA
jgi:uncharacterized protein YndB with AHSA1/START domain